MLINLDLVPVSYKDKFGPIPSQNSQYYQMWIHNVWNNWLVRTSEVEKQKYREMDKVSSLTKSLGNFAL